MTATVEPNIKLGSLMSAIWTKSLMPLVVPELPEISIGGAFPGQIGESSSFKYGILDRTLAKVETGLDDVTIQS